MTLVLASLSPVDSAIARLDPRWKLAAVVLATGAVALLGTLRVAAAALAASIALVLVSRLPLQWYLRRIMPVLLIAAALVLTLPFLVDGSDDRLVLAGPLAVSATGLRLASMFACKALAMMSLMLVLIGTDRLEALLQAAHALRAPGLLVQITAMTYRYLFLLAVEFSQLRIALRLRAYRNRMSFHSYRTIGHVAGSLLVRSHDRAERVSQAMRCRGFHGRFQSLTSFHTHMAEVLAFLLIVGTALSLLVWDHFSHG